MKHIKEFNIFEVASPGGRVSLELQKRYPKLASAIKNEFRYFFSRGLFGYFDVSDKPNGTAILKYVPQNEEIPAIEFNAFTIPDYSADLKSLVPTSSKNWQEEDINSIDAFSDALKINSWSEEYKKNIANRISIYQVNPSPAWMRYYQTPQYKYFEEYLKLILPNTKYTVPGEEEDVTLDQIKSTNQYQDLISLGAIDDTSERVWKNRNLRITHPILFYDGYDYRVRFQVQGKDTITIYSGGPIRVTSASRQAIINSAPGFKIINLDGWERKIDWVTKYLMKRIAKDQFDVKSRKKKEELANLPLDEYYTELLNMGDDVFIDWLLSNEEDFVTSVLDSGIDLKSYIEKDPAKAAIKLKKIYKHPSVKKAIDSLDSESTKDFADTVTLTGNLGEIGF